MPGTSTVNPLLSNTTWPTAESLTTTALQHACSLYPLVLSQVQNNKSTSSRKRKFESSGDQTSSKLSLSKLDQMRYVDIPEVLRSRKQDTGRAWLEKSEVEVLVEWKLAHGKYRPTLPALVASNPADLVKDTTQTAFTHYDSSDSRLSTHKRSIELLSSLKGIGPATAALLLSVHDQVTAPFFSDELFRWVCCDGDWKASIKYNKKEYEILWDEVDKLRVKLDKSGEITTAVDLEKAAWVYGKVGIGEVEIDKSVSQGTEVALSALREEKATKRPGSELQEAEADMPPYPRKRVRDQAAAVGSAEPERQRTRAQRLKRRGG